MRVNDPPHDQPAADALTVLDYQESFAFCELHTPNKWEGDGTCVICEAAELKVRAEVAEQRVKDLEAEAFAADEHMSHKEKELARAYGLATEAERRAQAAEATIASLRTVLGAAEEWLRLTLAPCEPDCACVLHTVQRALAEGTAVPDPPASPTTITDDDALTRRVTWGSPSPRSAASTDTKGSEQ